MPSRATKFKLRERVALIEVRRSLVTPAGLRFLRQRQSVETYYSTITTLPAVSEEESIFKALRGDNTFFNGREVFVLTNTQDYLLRVLLIRKLTAIVHLETPMIISRS